MVEEKQSESVSAKYKAINTKNFRFKIKLTEKNFLKYERKSYHSPPKKIPKYQIGHQLDVIKTKLNKFNPQYQ